MDLSIPPSHDLQPIGKNEPIGKPESLGKNEPIGKTEPIKLNELSESMEVIKPIEQNEEKSELEFKLSESEVKSPESEIKLSEAEELKNSEYTPTLPRKRVPLSIVKPKRTEVLNSRLPTLKSTPSKRELLKNEEEENSRVKKLLLHASGKEDTKKIIFSKETKTSETPTR